MHDLHVIQGPNVTRDARKKIAFFAFHTFVVEDSGPDYTTAAHAFVKATLRLGLRAPFVARNNVHFSNLSADVAVRGVATPVSMYQFFLKNNS